MAASNQDVIISLHTTEGPVPIFMYAEPIDPRRTQAENGTSQPSRSRHEGTSPRLRRSRSMRATHQNPRHDRLRDLRPPPAFSRYRRRGQAQEIDMSRLPSFPNGSPETTSISDTYQRNGNPPSQDPVWTAEGYLSELRPHTQYWERRAREWDFNQTRSGTREDFSQLCRTVSMNSLDGDGWRDPSTFRSGRSSNRNRLELQTQWIKFEARHRVKNVIEVVKRISSRLLLCGRFKLHTQPEVLVGLEAGEHSGSGSEFVYSPQPFVANGATSNARQASRRQGFLRAVDVRRREQLHEAEDEWAMSGTVALRRNLRAVSRLQDEIQANVLHPADLLNLNLDDLHYYLASVDNLEVLARALIEDRRMQALEVRRDAQLEEDEDEEESRMWSSHSCNLAEEDEFWGRRANAQAWEQEAAERRIEVEYMWLRSGEEQLPVYQGKTYSPPAYQGSEIEPPSYAETSGDKNRC